MAMAAVAHQSDEVPGGPSRRFNVQDTTQEALSARVAELERVCADVLLAAMDGPLPQTLMHRLWFSLSHGERPTAFQLDLMPSRALSSHGPAVVHEMPPRPGSADLRPLPVRPSLLVVDDDAMMLNVLQRILDRENVELLMAASGAEALRILEQRGASVDLLVTDFVMPGMDGRTLADLVRQRWPDIKVLYQTGFSELLFDNRLELEDGAAFLEKPFTARGLREAVRLALFGALNPS
jgi:CheY-like chemotaxis protein